MGIFSRGLKSLLPPNPLKPGKAIKSLLSSGGVPGGPKFGQLDPAGLFGSKKKTSLISFARKI